MAIGRMGVSCHNWGTWLVDQRRDLFLCSKRIEMMEAPSVKPTNWSWHLQWWLICRWFVCAWPTLPVVWHCQCIWTPIAAKFFSLLSWTSPTRKRNLVSTRKEWLWLLHICSKNWVEDVDSIVSFEVRTDNGLVLFGRRPFNSFYSLVMSKWMAR